MDMRLRFLAGVLSVVTGCAEIDADFDEEGGGVETHSEALTFAKCDGSVRVQIDGTHDATYNTSLLTVYDNGTSFPAAHKGPRPASDPDFYQEAWFSPTIKYHDLPALTYRTRRCSQTGDCEGYTTQKLHHHFLKHTDEEVSVASPARRYVGFGFRVDSYSEPSEDLGQIDGTPLVFQMWQGSPHRPPFAAHLVPDGDGSSSLVFIVRSNTVGGGSGWDSDNGHEIGRMPVNLDQWYEIVLSLYPEPDEDTHRSGNVTVGVYYRKAGNSTWSSFKYYGKWSYNTTNPGCPYVGDCSQPDPNDVVDFKMGIYKSTRSYTKHKVSFANIKAATEFAYADPTYFCTDTY